MTLNEHPVAQRDESNQRGTNSAACAYGVARKYAPENFPCRYRRPIPGGMWHRTSRASGGRGSVSVGGAGYSPGMDNDTTQLALSGAVVGGVVPFLVGVVIVGALIWAVWWGRRIRSQEPGPPRPDEQPRLPDSGPVGEVRERREPAEMPRGNHRLTSHRLRGHGNSSTRRAANQKPPTWNENGGGGPGRT